MSKKILFILIIVLVSKVLYSQSSIWKDISESEIVDKGERVIVPYQYRICEFDIEAITKSFRSAPIESTGEIPLNTIEVLLPMPDGTNQRFAFWESPTMAPELQSLYPEIRTYTGQGSDDKYASIKMDVTPHGFHAMILSPNGRVFIDPYFIDNSKYYISYFTKDYHRSGSLTDCELLVEEGKIEELNFIKQNADLTSTGPQLRTYRLCVAATGEYTAFHGGTVALGLAAVVTSVNRVNGVYEKEVAIRMVLVPNNNLVIYTNAATDPYSNGSGSTMLGQNISNLSTVIGNSNFDIGHVFSTGGGGVAYLGSVCTSSKAGGVTGSSSPIGDPFDIDYVAHEMGHQFGGNHSFNSVTGSCGGGNRNSSTAYEPGSGSTIMAYAGICGVDDLQPHSDAYFHVVNFDEIVLYTNSGNGNTCAVTTSTGNNAPIVTVPAGSFYIPKSTPFSLTGSATDSNGDALTYCWEEYDLGPSGSPGSPSGNAPIFRSFDPTTLPTRIFPKLSDILNNTSTIGELLPTYARTLTFRLSVRDNKAGGGGVDWKSISFNVDGNSGPFTLTAPNTNVSWLGNSIQTITWNVANTSIFPVSCSNVRILLSTDSGNNFNTVLLGTTTNDGSEQVTIPNLPTTQARIKVEAVGNIFFDISNANFTIVNNPGVNNPLSFTASTIGSSQIELTFSPNNANNNVVIVWNNTGVFTSPTGLPPSIGNPFAGGTLLYNGILSPQVHSNLNAGTDYFYKAFSFDASSYSSGITSNSSTNAVPDPSTFGSVPLSSTEILLLFTPNMISNNVVIVWNNSGTFTAPNGNPPSTGQPFAGGTLLYNGINSPQLHNNIVPSTNYFYKAFSFDGVNYSNGVTTDTTTLNSSSSFQLTVNIQDSWNTVSIPGNHPNGNSVNNWWPYRDLAANVFKYQGGYQSVDTLVPGIGYWLKHSGSRTYNTGDEWPASGILSVLHNPIPAYTGFNLFGGYEDSIATSGITTTPIGLIAGSVFSYSPGFGYTTTSILRPGNGYFLKLSGNGLINLPTTFEKPIVNTTKFKFNNYNRIIINDNLNNSYTLFLTDENTDLDNYELPPPPPAEIFDIRFSSGRFVEDLSKEEQSIVLQGLKFPIKIKSEKLNFRIKDESGSRLNGVLKADEELIISDNSIEKLIISKEIIPTQFLLEQNFPNPFNPSTSIKFSIPDKSYVIIKIYNSIGEEIKNLVSDEYEVGSYTISFNASEMVSGVYIYKMIASKNGTKNSSENFVQSKKMLLLK